MLRVKIKINTFDIILADIYSMSEPKTASEILSKATCPVVIWTIFECATCKDKGTYQCQIKNCPNDINNTKKIMRKPAHFDDGSLDELFSAVSVAHEHSTTAYK